MSVESRVGHQDAKQVGVKAPSRHAPFAELRVLERGADVLAWKNETKSESRLGDSLRPPRPWSHLLYGRRDEGFSARPARARAKILSAVLRYFPADLVALGSRRDHSVHRTNRRALVLFGLRTGNALIALGMVLVIVTFGHLLHDALFDFSGHVIPRLALLLFVLSLPREDDRFSLDYFLKR